jgi:hypothetical protein
MVTTREWAATIRDVSIEDNPPARTGWTMRRYKTVRQIAVRTLCLHSVVAVGYGIDSEMMVESLQEQKIWRSVTPREKAFMLANDRTEPECGYWRLKEEAQWAMLWMISKVDALGLPDHRLDTKRLVDEIMPPPYADIAPFIAAAVLRPRGLLQAEDSRSYDIWCAIHMVRRENLPYPEDLLWSVLEERRRAFEWIYGRERWDEVTADA